MTNTTPSLVEIDWLPGEGPNEELMPLSAHARAIAAGAPEHGSLRKYLLHISNRLQEYEEAADTIERVEALAAEYATHRYGCPQNKWEAGWSFIACTCGYKAALAKTCEHPPRRVSVKFLMDKSRADYCDVCDELRRELRGDE